MHLITHQIVELGALASHQYEQMFNEPVAGLFLPATNAKYGHRPEYRHFVDVISSAQLAARAKTIIFKSDQALAFMRSIDMLLRPGDYAMPFAELCIQFDKGIDEKLFTTGLKIAGQADQADDILGLLMHMDERTQTFAVSAFYRSTSFNRVIVSAADGKVLSHKIQPTPGLTPEAAQTMKADKQRIANLALMCLAYISTPGLTVERVHTPAAVNARRAKHNKRQLDDYYICNWTINRDKTKPATGEHSHGTPHTFRYDVAGHFRHYADGRTIWVKSHQRGLANEKYVPKTYVAT